MQQQSARKLEILHTGRIDYAASVLLQQELVGQRLAGAIIDRLLIVEHPATVTLGRRGQETDLLFPETHLQQHNIAVHQSNRGGQATAHEPGQLVVYPILELQERDLHLYSQRLLETISIVLRQYNLDPHLKEGQPGVWVAGRKIASIGVAVRKWVTSHGIALNVNNDLSTFEMIVPCGHADETLTSMVEQLGRPVELAEVEAKFLAAFLDVFDYSDL